MKLQLAPRIEPTLARVLSACGGFSLAVTILLVLVLTGTGEQLIGGSGHGTHLPAPPSTTALSPLELDLDLDLDLAALIAGTVRSSLIAMMVALPLGLLAAIYVSEFAADSQRRRLQAMLELLASLPTLVYGLCALIVVGPSLRELIPDARTLQALIPGLVMGVMLLPTVAAHAALALRGVPHQLREAACGLGADRVATVFGVVVPSAASGIAAACILAWVRALGETVVVTMVAGDQLHHSLDPRAAIETLTSSLLQSSTNTALAATDSSMYLVASVLLASTMGSTLIAELFRRHQLSLRGPG